MAGPPHRLAATAAVAIPFAAGSSVSATSSLFGMYQTMRSTDTQAVAIGDVTGDGLADVVATAGNGFTEYRVFVIAGLPDGTFDAPVSYATAGSGRTDSRPWRSETSPMMVART